MQPGKRWKTCNFQIFANKSNCGNYVFKKYYKYVSISYIFNSLTKY